MRLMYGSQYASWSVPTQVNELQSPRYGCDLPRQRFPTRLSALRHAELNEEQSGRVHLKGEPSSSLFFFG